MSGEPGTALTVGDRPPPCPTGTEHVVKVYLEGERPERIRCLRCRLLFVRDSRWPQGYRPVKNEDPPAPRTRRRGKR